MSHLHPITVISCHMYILCSHILYVITSHFMNCFQSNLHLIISYWISFTTHHPAHFLGSLKCTQQQFPSLYPYLILSTLSIHPDSFSLTHLTLHSHIHTSIPFLISSTTISHSTSSLLPILSLYLLSLSFLIHYILLYHSLFLFFNTLSSNTTLLYILAPYILSITLPYPSSLSCPFFFILLIYSSHHFSSPFSPSFPFFTPASLSSFISVLSTSSILLTYLLPPSSLPQRDLWLQTACITKGCQSDVRIWHTVVVNECLDIVCLLHACLVGVHIRLHLS